MKLAICSYTFSQLTKAGTMDVFGYLEACRYRYGLGAADLWYGTLASLDEAYLTQVKAEMAERDLVLADFCIDGAHIWEDDPDVREAHYQKALVHLDAAEFLGAQTVRIDTGGSREKLTWTDEQFDTIVSRYREYARRAHDNGYKIGPENHWGAEVAPLSMKKLCEAVDHLAFGVLLHAGRWRGEDAERGDELIIPWAMHTHFNLRLSDEALLATMTQLRDSGYTGYYSVEINTVRRPEVAIMLVRLRDVGEQWRLAG